MAGLLQRRVGGGPLVADNNLSPDVFMGGGDQFAPGVVLSLTNNAGDHLRFELLGTTQTLAGIETTYAAQRGIIQNRDIGPSGLYSNAQLVLNGEGRYFYSGYLRDSQIGGSNRLGLAKVGTGTQTLWGTVIDYTAPTIIGAGALVLTNVDDLWSTALTISNGARLVVDTSARTFQYRGKTTITGAARSISSAGRMSRCGATTTTA